MQTLEHVPVKTLPPERFEEVLDEHQWKILDAANRHAREIFGARRVWNVNSTASGGGVAEMLHSLIAYARGAQVDARWVVIEGEPDFFTLTKRIHHQLHGSAGDGLGLGDADREVYERVTRENAERLAAELHPGDLVLLHDPQTAGMVPLLSRQDVHVLWRSHIGIDRPNEHVDAAWRFLLPYLEPAQAFIFTRPQYAPPELADRDITIIPPSIDVFSQKNHTMTTDQVTSILSVGAISIPPFVLAIYALLAFSVNLGWFPVLGAGDAGDLGDQIWHLVLPAFAVGLGWVGYLARLVRGSMIEVMAENHVRTARALGLPERRILFSYALRLAIIPTVTLLGISIGGVLSSAVLVENVFSRPGLGTIIAKAAAARNYPIVQGGVFASVILFVIATPISDLIIAWLDPRVRDTL